jgi:hypothetical protein
MQRQNALVATSQNVVVNVVNASSGSNVSVSQVNSGNGNGVVSVQATSVISGDTSQANAASNKAYYART